MKRHTIWMMSIAVALALWVVPVSAQQQGQRMTMRADTSTEGGMMMMMNNPVMRSAVMVSLLPSLQQALNLSEDQVQRLRGTQENYEDRRQTLLGQMQSHMQQMQTMMEGEQPEPPEFRSMLRQGAEIRAEIMALAYETAAEMRGMLTNTQRQQLAQTSHAEMHRYMMSNMTMMDMMQSMQSMMMHCPMMDSPQRGGRMMRGMGMMPGGRQGGMHEMMQCMMMGGMMP